MNIFTRETIHLSLLLLIRTQYERSIEWTSYTVNKIFNGTDEYYVWRSIGESVTFCFSHFILSFVSGCFSYSQLAYRTPWYILMWTHVCGYIVVPRIRNFNVYFNAHREHTFFTHMKKPTDVLRVHLSCARNQQCQCTCVIGHQTVYIHNTDIVHTNWTVK